jgi:hypothetical protein
MDDKYKEGKIYVIKYNDEIKYVGHTIMSLHDRFGYHRRNTFNETYASHNARIYKYIRETNDWKNWSIQLYLDYPCNNKQELCKKEGEIIKLLNPPLNYEIAGRTQKEWYDDTKEDNKEKRSMFFKNWKSKNEEHLKEFKTKYWHENKEKLSVKVICECGCEISKRHLKEHQQSNRHQKIISKLNVDR